jgi:hypothetical protein
VEEQVIMQREGERKGRGRRGERERELQGMTTKDDGWERVN